MGTCTNSRHSGHFNSSWLSVVCTQQSVSPSGHVWHMDCHATTLVSDCRGPGAHRYCKVNYWHLLYYDTGLGIITSFWSPLYLILLSCMEIHYCVCVWWNNVQLLSIVYQILQSVKHFCKCFMYEVHPSMTETRQLHQTCIEILTFRQIQFMISKHYALTLLVISLLRSLYLRISNVMLYLNIWQVALCFVVIWVVVY
jgi:hypothetical protein